jgi:hypothetical protein
MVADIEDLWPGHQMKGPIVSNGAGNKIAPILLLFSALLGFSTLTTAQESQPTSLDNSAVNIWRSCVRGQ